MENRNSLWRSFFAIGLLAIAVQQVICRDFRPVILPSGYPAWLSQRFIWDCIFSVLLAIACVSIILSIKARSVSLLLATVFLLIVIMFQLPCQQYPVHLSMWTNVFKELTYSGGAFLVAGSLPRQGITSGLINFLEKLIPMGKYFFAITMAVFGYMHFVYPDFVATLVPNWIPGHLFWTYFAGVALMAGGIGIIVNIKRHLAANLTGIMIFIWLIVLHVPRAIADPHSGDGNEWTSVFEALSFSGIAFLIGREEVKH
ncbi:hypothetical protein ACPPVU_10410 [Mucilaginibacter sp. McL0603]|uniref:hypothetical protein n=1 Tax=Mucilaginibacter sp. McL0603 TaxID=3415670 RepID=UPI003CED2A4E